MLSLKIANRSALVRSSRCVLASRHLSSWSRQICLRSTKGYLVCILLKYVSIIFAPISSHGGSTFVPERSSVLAERSCVRAPGPGCGGVPVAGTLVLAGGLLDVGPALRLSIFEMNWFQTLVWTISPRLAAKERPELEPT